MSASALSTGVSSTVASRRVEYDALGAAPRGASTDAPPRAAGEASTDAPPAHGAAGEASRAAAPAHGAAGDAHDAAAHRVLLDAAAHDAAAHDAAAHDVAAHDAAAHDAAAHDSRVAGDAGDAGDVAVDVAGGADAPAARPPTWGLTTEELYSRPPGAAPVFSGRFAATRARLDYAFHAHYTPERAAVQDAIVAAALQGGVPVERPWIVFTAGAMGAGAWRAGERERARAAARRRRWDER